jgi:hypothetical protein
MTGPVVAGVTTGELLGAGCARLTLRVGLGRAGLRDRVDAGLGGAELAEGLADELRGVAAVLGGAGARDEPHAAADTMAHPKLMVRIVERTRTRRDIPPR